MKNFVNCTVVKAPEFSHTTRAQIYSGMRCNQGKEG